MQRDELIAHLHGCSDAKAHAVHRKHVQAAEARAAKKESVRDAEDEAQNVAAWQFLGGATEQMWLLTDGALGGCLLTDPTLPLHITR